MIYIKNRTVGLWMTAAVIVAVLLFFNIFGLPFSDNDAKGGIVLPGDSSDNVGVDIDNYSSNLDLLQKVEVDKSNIKLIINALQRPETYHISANSTIYYSDGQSSMAAEGYIYGGTSRTVVYGDGTRQNCLINGENVYIWPEGSSSYYSGKKGDFSEDDYIYIPTYEKILSFDDEAILNADYSLYNDRYCLYVEVYEEMSGYRSLYYISVENGLLIGAQSFEGDMLVYSLSCDVLDMPDDLGDIFTLPDGKTVEIE